MFAKIRLLLLLTCIILLTTACSVDYSGQYGGLSDEGIFISMKINKDGTVETNILGLPITGNYSINNNTITITLTTFGYSQSIQGRISQDTIEFADVILKKGTISTLPAVTKFAEYSSIPTVNDNTVGDSAVFALAPDSITFSDETVLQAVCSQYGLDTLQVTESELLKVTELNINITSNGLYDFNKVYNLSLADLQYLPNLEILRIKSSYQINVDLKGINRCDNLRILVLQNCQFNDLERIGVLIGLEELYISSERGEGVNDYSPLANLIALKKLSLIWTGYNAYNEYHLKDASSISSLVNLEELTISHVSINNYSLAAMTKLKKVELTNYDAQILFDELYSSGAWQYLQHLRCYVRNMETQTLTSLSRLTNLKYLYLSIDIYGSATNLNGIENLTQLETLIIPSIPYKFDNMDAIGKLTALKELRISDSADRGPLSYINNLINLTVLELGTSQDISLSQFSNLKQLETIEINFCAGMNYNNRCIDLSGVGNLSSLKEIIYFGYKIKSTMPLDDYPEIVLTERGLTW